MVDFEWIGQDAPSYSEVHAGVVSWVCVVSSLVFNPIYIIFNTHFFCCVLPHTTLYLIHTSMSYANLL